MAKMRAYTGKGARSLGHDLEESKQPEKSGRENGEGGYPYLLVTSTPLLDHSVLDHSVLIVTLFCHYIMV
jgi:hypothetical protein